MITPRWIAGRGYVDSALPEAWKRMGYRCRRADLAGDGYVVLRPDGTIAASRASAGGAWSAAIRCDTGRIDAPVCLISSLATDNLDGVYEAALDELERDPSLGWERALERARGVAA